MQENINDNDKEDKNQDGSNLIFLLREHLPNIRNLNELIFRIINSINELVAIQDNENTIIWVNYAAASSVNLEIKDLIGKKCFKIWHERDVPCENCPVIECIKSKKPQSNTMKSLKNHRYWLINGYPIIDVEGKAVGAIEITTEITESIVGKIFLEEAEIRYKTLFENSIDGIYVTTPDGRYIDVNPALVNMLGYDSKEELLNINIPENLYVSKKDRPGPFERDKIFETKLIKKDGSIINVEISSKVIWEDGKPKYYLGIVRDITERKKLESKLNYLSFHDSLTGLYNRAYFEEEVKRLNTRRQFPITFIMGDVNNLKLVNDVFGHKKGDKLLKHCAKFLKKYTRKEDIVARWGGDEFAIVLSKTKKEDAERIIKRIEQCCKNNYIDGKIPVSISFGIVTVEKNIKNIDTVLRDAENKMYNKKLIEKRNIFNNFVSSLERELFNSGLENETHIGLILKLAVKLAKALNISENKINDLTLLVSLHDIGKVAINKNLIKKKTKLTKKEYEEIKRHSEISYNILKTSPATSPIAEDALYHHECWDGSGYPQGLSGEDIPILSRILSVVKAYVSMITGSNYKDNKVPLSKKEAIEQLKRSAGIKFDPRIVDKFIKVISEDLSN